MKQFSILMIFFLAFPAAVLADTETEETFRGKVKVGASVVDMMAPANVANLQATVYEKQIELKWQNPVDADLKSIRILRSEIFFPMEPELEADKIVFDRKGESFIDVNVETGKTYFYTVFSYDYAGNFSSGALASGEMPFKYLKEAPKEEIPPSVKNLTLEDFDFFQGGRKIDFSGDDAVNVKPNIPLTVSIDYEKLPEVLKTIIVTLEKPAGSKTKLQRTLLKLGSGVARASGNSEYFSFLLRVDSGKTAYRAKIMPPETGDYPLTIGVLDVKNRIFKKISGILNVKGENKNFPMAGFALLILILAAAAWQLRGKLGGLGKSGK